MKKQYPSEYTSWAGLKDRCLRKKNAGYNRYGGRGITFCPEWNTFSNFFADMGPKPDPSFSLDRIDNNKGYYKENCRWADRTTQNSNRSTRVAVDLNGESVSLKDISKQTGISYNTLYYRLNSVGVPASDLLKPLPLGPRKQKAA